MLNLEQDLSVVDHAKTVKKLLFNYFRFTQLNHI